MANESLMTRRAFLKGAFGVAALAGAGGLLSACSTQPVVESDSAESEPEPAVEDAQQPLAEPAASEEATRAGGILVACFSATGNTRGVADTIAQHLGADTFEIAPAEPYIAEDLDYNNADSRTSREREDLDRRVELVQVTPEDFDAYDIVFVGYPIWWGDASWVVDGFVSGNDFSGKTVVPFCTSGGSGMGQSGDNLAEMAGTGDWLPGARFSASASPAEVTAWVDGLGL